MIYWYISATIFAIVTAIFVPHIPLLLMFAFVRFIGISIPNLGYKYLDWVCDHFRRKYQRDIEQFKKKQANLEDEITKRQQWIRAINARQREHQYSQAENVKRIEGRLEAFAKGND